MASQWIKSQTFTRIWFHLTWPVSHCPGSLCSDTQGSLPFLRDWDTPAAEPLHRLFPLHGFSSLRCCWGSFFHFLKVSTKMSPPQGDYPWQPAPFLSFPFLSFTFFRSLTRIQYIIFIHVFAYHLFSHVPKAWLGHGCSINTVFPRK